MPTRNGLGTCPTPGCAIRWRDGTDRLCPDHAIDAAEIAMATVIESAAGWLAMPSGDPADVAVF